MVTKFTRRINVLSLIQTVNKIEINMSIKYTCINTFNIKRYGFNNGISFHEIFFPKAQYFITTTGHYNAWILYNSSAMI